MFGWIKAIWRIRALKKCLCAYQNEHLDRSPLLLDVVGALGGVAAALNREDLERWTKNELNGYAAGEVVPSYRQLDCEYKGDVQKCGQSLEKDYPLSELICRQHLHEWCNSFAYRGGLSMAIGDLGDSTLANCILKQYHGFGLAISVICRHVTRCLSLVVFVMRKLCAICLRRYLGDV